MTEPKSQEKDEYEYAGEWNCSHCGATRDIERKLDVLAFALGHSCDPESDMEDDQ